MRVSVVIPCYNSGPALEATIGSAISQSLRPHEILCYDDASTDGTRERLQALRARHGEVLRITHSDVNVGGQNLRHILVTAATGDWIAFLDHDDLWLPDKLQAQAELLHRHPNVEVIHTDGWNQEGDDPATRTLQKTPDYSGPANPYAALYFQNFILASSALLSRPACDRAGGARSGDLSLIGDYEMWLRMSRHGSLFARVPRPLVVRRVLATGQLAVFRLPHLRVRVRMYERYGAMPGTGPFALERREVRDRINLARLDLIRALLETGDPAHRPEAADLWRACLLSSGPLRRQRNRFLEILALSRFGPPPAVADTDPRAGVPALPLDAARREDLVQARRRAKRDPGAWRGLVEESAEAILRYGLMHPFLQHLSKEAEIMRVLTERVWGELR